ncbi:MAG: TraR/DksA C4-type zinc finger protein [Nitrospirae bacterium]|nr:TraR/DksA C4-type zinc finger protein [Nitrospirota bacterium]
MLSEAELQEFEEILKKLERETMESLHICTDSAQPVSLDHATGRLTRMDAIQQQQMALHTKGRLDLQLLRIRTALRRVSDGKFGECVKCGEFIGKRRLEIAPEIPVCMQCLQKSE